MDTWKAEGRGPHFEPAPFCSQYVQSMWSACIQTVHMCGRAQSKDLLRVEKTPFALRLLPQESNEMTCLCCKTGLENIELCSLCTKCLQHGCSPDGILNSGYLASNSFPLPGVTSVFSSSLLSCFLATYSNLQYLLEFATHQLPTHNSTGTSNIFRER